MKKCFRQGHRNRLLAASVVGFTTRVGADIAIVGMYGPVESGVHLNAVVECFSAAIGANIESSDEPYDPVDRRSLGADHVGVFPCSAITNGIEGVIFVDVIRNDERRSEGVTCYRRPWLRGRHAPFYERCEWS